MSLLLIRNSCIITIVTEYGKVIDIRINRGGGMSKVPFGFVVFDSDEPVKHLLRLQVSPAISHLLLV